MLKQTLQNRVKCRPVRLIPGSLSIATFRKKVAHLVWEGLRNLLESLDAGGPCLPGNREKDLLDKDGRLGFRYII